MSKIEARQEHEKTERSMRARVRRLEAELDSERTKRAKMEKEQLSVKEELQRKISDLAPESKGARKGAGVSCTKDIDVLCGSLLTMADGRLGRPQEEDALHGAGACEIAPG